MNQKEFIEVVAEEGDLSRSEAARAVKAMVKVIHGEMSGNGDVQIAGLGKFAVKERAARTGHNPATGEKIDIPAKRVPHFSAAKALKEAVA